MNSEVARLEVYIDDAREPLYVLTEPPFRIRLDTHIIPDGDHLLRVVTVFKNGKSQESFTSFTVDNLPDVLVEGLEEGAVVRGETEIDLKVGDYSAAPRGQKGPANWLYALLAVVFLGGTWAYFAFGPTAAIVAEEMAPAEAEAGGGNLLAAGEKVYQAQCASCHQAGGEGVPGAFPPLANNPKAADSAYVADVIQNGLSGEITVNGETFNGMMPPVSLSPDQLEAVVAFVTSEFGGAAEGESAPASEGTSAPDAEGESGAEETPAEEGGTDLAARGEEVYAASCTSCHMGEGQGVPGAFPPLANNPNLGDAAHVIDVIQNGLQGPLEVAGTTYNGMMPPTNLPPEDVAAVASYIRTNWGNDFGPVEPGQVE